MRFLWFWFALQSLRSIAACRISDARPPKPLVSTASLTLDTYPPIIQRRAAGPDARAALPAGRRPHLLPVRRGPGGRVIQL